jgi:hypothetical protein
MDDGSVGRWSVRQPHQSFCSEGHGLSMSRPLCWDGGTTGCLCWHLPKALLKLTLCSAARDSAEEAEQ